MRSVLDCSKTESRLAGRFKHMNQAQEPDQQLMTSDAEMLAA